MPDANGKPLRADVNTPNPLLGNVSYDVIKDIVTLAFPAAVTLYTILSGVWGWPFTEQIVASAGAVGVFLGVVLKIAQKRYENLPVQYDGELIANDPSPENETFRLEFDNSLPRMANQDVVRLRVVNLLPPEGEHPLDAEAA